MSRDRNIGTYDTHPLVGRLCKLKSNGARFLIEGASDNTVTIQGWIHRETISARDFAIRFELIEEQST